MSNVKKFVAGDRRQTGRRRPRFSSAVPLVAAIVIANSVTGCATIGTTEGRVSERLVRASKVEQVAEGSVAEISLKGLELRLSASHVCETREVRLLDRTKTTETFNKTPEVDWGAAGLGLALSVAGTAFIIDSKNVYPDDRTSRTYNPTGKTKATTTGVALLGTGLAVLTIPIVDVVRASETTVDKQRVTNKGAPLGPAQACESKPYVRADVAATVSELVTLGKTDDAGEMKVDLAEAVPDAEVTSLLKHITIWVDGHNVGTISALPLYEAKAAKAWRRLDQVVARCRVPSGLSDCEPVRAFLRSYPDTAYVAEAQKVLAAAEPHLHRILEAEDWASIRGKDCTTTSFQTPEEIENACRGLVLFIGRHPDGPHTKEAKEMARRGEARAAALAAKIAKAQRDEEAAEKATERRRCVGVCRMGCSSRRNFDQCFSGCVEARCP